MHTKIMNSHRLGMRLVLFMAIIAVIFSSALPVAAAPASAPHALPRVVSVSVGAQSGTLTAGTAGSVTYVVSVVKGTTNSLTLSNLTVTGGLPAGASASFSPASLSWTAAESGAKTSTLTINTTAATAGGSTTFTVRAARQGTSSDFATGNGTLAITIVQVAPTITFGPAPTPIYLGGNFIVAATTNSNGTRTYSAVSGPCTVVNSTLGIFSSSGGGTCVVQASTAATVNFLAGSAQQSVIIAPATPTLAFGANPFPIFPGGNFSVVAPTNSDGTRTYSWVSGPCTLVDATLGIFSPTGLGACVVRADTLATANFTAATAQQSVTIIEPGFDLYAVAGSTLLPGGASVPIWGYTEDSSPATRPGGPTLTVNQGDIVSIILHNTLGEATSLLIQGQAMVPDRVGAPSNGTKNYAFVADHAGTYLYEAGLLPNAEHQVAMGLYGALIVRPATPGQAYDDLNTAYDDEAVVVLSELDPAVSANPAGFDLRNYRPKYWLINGQAYPTTVEIPTAAGRKVLVRYVNAGLQHHSMAVLGLNQNVIATDGSPLAHAYNMVAETLAPGQTQDAILTVPTNAAAGSKFALYDGNLHLNNSNAAALGGMLTFLAIAPDVLPDDNVGPVTFAPTLAPNPTNGTVDLVLNASVSDAATGNANVTAAEYFIDTIGTNGLGTALAAADATFDSLTEAVVATIPSAALTGLSSGNHTIYIHGQDGFGNWGATNFVVLNLDKGGPATTGFLLGPNPSNGSADVMLSATGDDSATGNSNIVAAEYSLDGGPAQPMTVNNTNASIAGLTAVIPAAIVNGLSQGEHPVTVRSQDGLGNWGAVTQKNLLVDTTGPTSSNISAAPNPNNGATGLSANQLFVRVTAQFDDASVGAAANAEADTGNDNPGTTGSIQLYLPLVTSPSANAESGVDAENSANAAAVIPGTSYVKTAEGFIDSAGANGTGFFFTASDGLFDELSETGYADIPLTTIVQLSSGNHTIFVHGQDGAGNWGATQSVVLIIDKLPPTVGTVTLTPPATNNTPVVISAPASDVATGNSNIAAGEYFIDNSSGANGTGIAMTASPAAPASTLNATISAATLATLAAGTHTVYVRAKDAANNWSTLASATLRIDRTPPTFSGITLVPNSIPVGTASVTLNVNGSSDGAGDSGVTGGEYWLCPSSCTTPATGGGTAFGGLTTSIPAASLLAGQQYTMRARIRDAAGNWSTGGTGIRSAVLTVTPANNIFTDGFESGTLPGNWASRSTNTTNRLNATAGAALFGAFGLQAQGNNTNYVQNNFTPVAAIYDARFYFNPNNNNSSGGHVIFAAATSNAFSTQLFSVRYRRNGSQPQVQIQVGATANASWVNINNNAVNRIEVVWQSGGTLVLYVNSTAAAQTLTAGAGSVAAVRLGAVTAGGSNTLEFFDAFAAKSTASPLIGP